MAPTLARTRPRSRQCPGAAPAGWSFSLGPAWWRDCPIGPGDRVEVVLSAEGLQRGEVAADI